MQRCVSGLRDHDCQTGPGPHGPIMDLTRHGRPLLFLNYVLFKPCCLLGSEADHALKAFHVRLPSVT
jgi:hypothetical protein